MSAMAENLKDRTYLHERHHLSHQQIDHFLGENKSKDYIQEKLNNLKKVKLFLNITDRLRSNRIRFVCLKGPLLSYRIYGDPTVRLSSDLDLLIKQEDFVQALTLMQEDGYIFTEDFKWPAEKFKQELIMNACQHLSLFNNKLKYRVELHWTLTNSVPISQKDFRELIDSNLETITYAERSFAVMNKEMELLYLMIHGSKHGWNRLKWLIDISAYPFDNFNKELFYQLVKKLKADRIVGLTDYFVYAYFNHRLPVSSRKKTPTFLIRHTQKCLRSKIESEKTSWLDIPNEFLFMELLFPGFAYKINVIKELSTNQGDVTRHDFSNKLFYWFLRPYSFFNRRMRHD